MYPNYYKKVHNYINFFSLIEYKKSFCLVNIRIKNLSFDELRLIAQIRIISDYENKSKEDFIKALSETKQETTKPETLKSEKLKPETLKSEKLKPETPKPENIKSEIRVNKKKLKILRKDFDELRHKSSKKDYDTEKLFMLLKTKTVFVNQK